MEQKLRSLLRDKVNHLELSEILNQPVDVMIGVGNNERITLSLIGIKTIQDLADSTIFAQAFEKCYELEQSAKAQDIQLPSHKLTDAQYASSAIDLKQISQLNIKACERLERNLNIKNIVDMAQWGPYNIARYIKNIILSPAGTQ